MRVVIRNLAATGEIAVEVLKSLVVVMVFAPAVLAVVVLHAICAGIALFVEDKVRKFDDRRPVRSLHLVWRRS